MEMRANFAGSSRKQNSKEAAVRQALTGTVSKSIYSSSNFHGGSLPALDTLGGRRDPRSRALFGDRRGRQTKRRFIPRTPMRRYPSVADEDDAVPGPSISSPPDGSARTPGRLSAKAAAEADEASACARVAVTVERP